jgi:hypothetical protein
MTTRRTIRCGARMIRMATLLTVAAAGLSIGGALLAQEPAAKPPAAAGETRTWTDITGKFSREAEFLKLEEGQVHLRLKGGKETKIPLKELSKKDRDWVRKGGAAKGAANESVAKPVGSRMVFRSYKALVDDSVFLADVLKQQALAGAVPGFFVALTGGKPLDGFDIGKPIVVTIHVDEQGQPAGTLVAVPVQGKERFQKTLETVFPAKMTPKGRSYEIAMLGKGVFAKPGEGYFLLSDDADLVRSAAADPPAPVVVSDVAVESFNTAISEEVRRAGFAQFDAMLSMVPIPPNLPEEAQRGWDETMKIIRAMVERLTLDTDRSSFEATIDPTTKSLSVALALRARSGTPMAETFAAYGSLRPTFAGPGEEATFGWAGVSLPASRLIRDALELNYGASIRTMRATVEKNRGKKGVEEIEQAIDRCDKEVQRLIAVEHYEQEISLGVDDSGELQIVSRMAYDGAKDYVAAWHDIMALALQGNGVTKDADGIVSVTLPAANQSTLGGPTKYPVRALGTDGAMIFGIGCADVAPMKAMTGGAASRSDSSPLSARLDLARLWPLVAKASPATSSLADAVGEDGNLRADVSALSDGIELRINADPGVLRLLGALGAAAAQAQGAAGFPGFPGAPGFPGSPPGIPGPGGPPAGLLPPSIQGFPIPPVTPPGPPQAPAP